MLTVANDTRFIPRSTKGFTPGANPPLTAELVESVRHYHRFHRLGLTGSVVDRAARGADTYSEFVSELHSEPANSKGKPLEGRKPSTKVHQNELDSACGPITDRGRDTGHPAPPAQIRTRATNAYGSSLGSITKRRSPSYGLAPSRTGLNPLRSRRCRGLPVLAHVRRAGRPLAIERGHPCCLPIYQTRSAP